MHDHYSIGLIKTVIVSNDFIVMKKSIGKLIKGQETLWTLYCSLQKARQKYGDQYITYVIIYTIYTFYTTVRLFVLISKSQDIKKYKALTN